MSFVLYCESCAHYVGLGACVAFPDGIPLEIIAGEKQHNKPMAGDGGYRYKEADKASESLADEIVKR